MLAKYWKFQNKKKTCDEKLAVCRRKVKTFAWKWNAKYFCSNINIKSNIKIVTIFIAEKKTVIQYKI